MKNIPNISLSGTNGYNLSAVLFGLNGSAGAGIFNSAGAELVIMTDGTIQPFIYAGQGSGLGGAFAPYGGLVFNLDSVDSYTGPFNNFTLAVGPGDGIQISCFYDEKIPPFQSGGVQGFTIGPAAVALISVSATRTDYIQFP